ncbi:MAG: BACON domain-containing protein, partial [bacterium]|nr:BACON domain-containing protein [bacterium]
CLVRISEASDGDPSDTSDEIFSITSGDPPVISLNRQRLNFASELSGATSGNENLVISNTGGDSLAWTATDNAAWLNLSPTSGTDFSTVTVSVDSTGLGAGTYTAAITVNGTGAENTPQQVSVTLKVYQNGNTGSPFGEFATPAEGSTVSSSVPVTGWVLDDIGIESVQIYNGESYVGDALLVEGARTDIEQSYPSHPGNYKAGWGYMLLTYFLPDGGNGTYTLTARATDKEGNIVSLGSKTVTINNNSAVKPFGAIDSPAQGGAAFGSSFRNAGWVLTPQPNTVPADGSTINVYVDGVFLGNPVYNIYRPDIAALFPGYNNSNTAHAYFDFDTTAYSNGVHTIYWVATDDAGNADGIGSRFFTIANTESVQLVSSMQGFKAKKQTFDPAAVPVNVSEPVSVIKGYGKNVTPKNVYPNQKGFIKIEIKELERVVLDLGARSGISGSEYFAYTRVGKQLRDLPAGSTLDSQKGLLYWQPGPGFVGTYDLVLFAKDKNGMVKKTNLRIKITPRFQ